MGIADLLAELQHLELVALFLLGFLGSGHCVGMCGPLIVAFPARRGKLLAHVLYNLGRVCTYALVGAVLAGIGAGTAAIAGSDSLLWTTRIQLGFSGLAALFLTVFGLSKLGFLSEPDLLSLATPARIPGFRRVQARVLGGRGMGSLFLLGLLLGLLPCGLSYAAFARAMAAESPLWGAVLTLVFGLGTMPALFAVGLGASRLSARHRRISDLVAGILTIAMAAALAGDVLRAF